jgi:hypothetical protein
MGATVFFGYMFVFDDALLDSTPFFGVVDDALDFSEG